MGNAESHPEYHPVVSVEATPRPIVLHTPPVLRGGRKAGGVEREKQMRQKQQQLDEVRSVCMASGVTAVTARRMLYEEEAQEASRSAPENTSHWVTNYFV